MSNFRVVKGIAVYTGNFTPPTSPLTTSGVAAANVNVVPSANVSYLGLNSNKIIDTSINQISQTVTGTVTVEKFSPFGLTANASPTFTGGSAYFDGTGDYLTSSGSTAFTMGTGPFTVEYWVYQTVNTGTYTQHVGSANGSSGWAYGASSVTPYMTSSTVGYVASVAYALNTWNHIAWTRDSSGNVRCFLNGVMIYGPTSITTTITETNFGIGATTGGSYTFTGYLSDIRVIKGMNTYTGNFTPPSAPLNLGGNSTIYSNTANVNTTFAASNATLMLNFTDAAIKDATTYFNLETAADAKLGFETAYSGSYYSTFFDASGDYLSINATLLPATSTSTFTIDGWIYPLTFASTKNIIGDMLADGTDYLDVQVSTSGTVQLYWYDGSGKTCTSNATLKPNTWNYFSVVVNSNAISISVNGVAGTLGGTTTLTNRAGTTGGTFIGQTGGAATPNSYISNMRVSTIARSSAIPTAPFINDADTRMLLFQSNRFIDNSTNRYTLTIFGDTAIRSFNPFQRNPGSSFYFDGTGDYLRIANNQSLAFGTGNFTIEFWANMTTNPSNQVILDQRPDGSHGAYPAILFESKYIRWYVSSATRIQSTSTLTLNTWYHVAICRVGGTTTMYINGNVSGSTWADSTNYLTGAAGLVIGASTWSGGSANMNGYIDDLRITRGNARYTANFTPSITMLSVR
jgi:hypothetical protein